MIAFLNDGHTSAETIALFALVLQGVALLGGGIWIVSRIKNATDVLSVSITSLHKSIDKLDATISAIEARVDDLGQRVARMEG